MSKLELAAMDEDELVDHAAYLTDELRKVTEALEERGIQI